MPTRTSLRLLVALLLLVCAACQPKQPTSVLSDPPPAQGAAGIPADITVRFGYPVELYPDERYYDDLEARFEEVEPQIDIVVEPLSTGELIGLFTGQAVTDTLDVLLLPSFLLDPLLGREQLHALDPWAEVDDAFGEEDFYPAALEACRRDGRLFAVPAALDPTVVYYNADLLEAAGAPYPFAGWTWDDMLATATAVRDERAAIYGITFINKAIEALPFIYAHGGRVFDDLTDPTMPTLDDPALIETLDWLGALIHEYDAAEATIQETTAQSHEGIRFGRTAMWLGGFSERGGRTWPADMAWPYNWGMATIPRDEQLATILRVDALVLYAHAEDADAAWAWISFLSHELPADGVPARRGLAESEAWEDLVGSEAAATARASLEGIGLPANIPGMSFFAPQDDPRREWARAYMRGVDRVLLDGDSATEAMLRAQEQALAAGYGQ